MASFLYIFIFFALAYCVLPAASSQCRNGLKGQGTTKTWNR
jgi:hypothetical protein